MKKIEAIIKEEQLSPVKTALEAAGFIGMTFTPVKGRGTSGGITLEWRAGSYTVDFLNKILLMLVVPADKAEAVVDIILTQCQQDNADPSGGGGKIFISPVEEVIRIRTGERNLSAI